MQGLGLQKINYVHLGSSCLRTVLMYFKGTLDTHFHISDKHYSYNPTDTEIYPHCLRVHHLINYYNNSRNN